MQNKQKNKVSKLPLFICFLFISAIFAYLYLPIFNKVDSPAPIKNNKNINSKKRPKQLLIEKNIEPQIEQSLFSKYYNNKQQTQPNITNTSKNTNFYSLLDELKTLPVDKKETALTIVEKLLEQKKYPKNLINIEYEQIMQNAINNSETITIAYFDYINGKIKINELALSKISTPELITVIAHELEHFDTIAKLYKSLDLKNKSLIETKTDEIKIPFDKTFWNKASEYTYTMNFDANEYISDFIAYLKTDEIHTLSIYPYLNQISKHINNKLEKKAYAFSDDISSYFNLPKQNQSIITFAKEFEKINHSLTSSLETHNNLKGEEECLFDYFLIQILAEENQQYKTLYQESTLYNDSDMTEIQKKLLDENKHLFKLDKKIKNTSFAHITDLLKKIQSKINQTISNEIIIEAMEYKINTITNNIHKESTKELLKEKILKYITFAKEQNILTPEKELKYLITLICLENKLYTNNSNSFQAVVYSNIPNELYEIYNIKNTIEKNDENNSENEKELIDKKNNKLKKFAFYKIIYTNLAFIEEKENRYTEIENSEFLKELINENKINTKI